MRINLFWSLPIKWLFLLLSSSTWKEHLKERRVYFGSHWRKQPRNNLRLWEQLVGTPFFFIFLDWDSDTWQEVEPGYKPQGNISYIDSKSHHLMMRTKQPGLQCHEQDLEECRPGTKVCCWVWESMLLEALIYSLGTLEWLCHPEWGL